MKKSSLLIISLIMIVAFSNVSHAYVDVEQATFWHFLVSRWFQVYVPPKTYRLLEPILKVNGLKADDFLKTEQGKYYLGGYNRELELGESFLEKAGSSAKNFLKKNRDISSRYSPELGAHLGWRLGCNIGWELAGAAMILKDHRSLNLMTLIEDSALTPGLLLYPVGQVIGQNIVGDYSLNLLNKYIKPMMLRGLNAQQLLDSKVPRVYSMKSAILVDEKGTPVVWENATVQRVASRFIGLAVGTYLSWSLFDLGHSLAWRKQPLLDAFAWDKYRILAMAGFTFGGYIGGNLGFTLSHKYLFPSIFRTRLYNNLAKKAETYLLNADFGVQNVSGIRKFALGFYQRLVNRNKLLWSTSHWTASPVNALFCTAFAIGLPWAVKQFEEWLIQNEVGEMEEPEDYARVFNDLKTDEEKEKFADSLVAELDSGFDLALSSLKESLSQDLASGGKLSVEQKSVIDKIDDSLSTSKPLLFETTLLMGMNSNAIVDTAFKKIDDIDSSLALSSFLSKELLPVLGLEDYAPSLNDELEKYLEGMTPQKLQEIKSNLKIFADFALPQIYSEKVSENLGYFVSIPELN